MMRSLSPELPGASELGNLKRNRDLSKIPVIETERAVITILSPDHYQLLLNYYFENKAHLDPWQPIRPSGYYSPESMRERLESNIANFRQGTAVNFVGLERSKQEVIAMCDFTNIVRGAFQACHLGCSVAAKYQGKGLMAEIVGPAIMYMFEEVGLHRIMANYIPSNTRSEKLLARLGFEKEGLAKSYLKIAGCWQDHVLTSKIHASHTTEREV